MGVTTRMRFPLNGLQFYLPLGHAGLNGATVSTKAPFGNSISFTVTGAVHTAPTHRAFDGDDFLRNISNDWLINDSSGTILIWVKYTSGTTLLCSWDTNALNSGFQYRFSSNKIMLETRSVAEGNDGVTGTKEFNDSTWHLVILTSNGSAWALYYDNGTVDTISATSGTNLGSWFADIPNRDNITIGCRGRTTPDDYINALVGEIWVYSRVLSTNEMKGIYNFTKGRYR
tara:strand:+ start:4740 stop:5426 length:687 start_codon:yes stop_codon:yes gene_type:complete